MELCWLWSDPKPVEINEMPYTDFSFLISPYNQGYSAKRLLHLFFSTIPYSG